MKSLLDDKKINNLIIYNSRFFRDFDVLGFRQWLYLHKGKPVYFDRLTYYMVYKIYQRIRDNYDQITIVTGYEGSGKSVLASQISTMVSPEMSINHVGYEPKDLIKIFKNIKRGDTIWLDEGALFLFSRNSLKKENKILVELLSIVRQLNLHLVICVPNFFILDTYLRDHRVNSLFHVVVNRKNFLYFNRDAISILNAVGKQTKNIIKGLDYINKSDCFVGRWNKSFGETPNLLEKDYISLKTSNMNDFMKRLEQTLNDTVGDDDSFDANDFVYDKDNDTSGGDDALAKYLS
jgi:hypothetical protein